MGYRRLDGRVGIRNYVAVIPSVFCANSVVKRIVAAVPDSVALCHVVGCGQVGYDFELTARTLKAIGSHPNIAAVLVVGLGCERFSPDELFDGIKASGKPVSKLVIQEDGGSERTVSKGISIVKEYVTYANELKAERCPISDLIIATKCGGTDATSGLAANPTVGNMVDKIIAMGGSVILSEFNELIGTENILAKRAINKEIADKIYSGISEIEEHLKNKCDLRYPDRNHLISPGNFAGGVSSIVEKALGGVHKGGTSPIVNVLDYAEVPKADQKGLFLMKYESHDGEVVTGMIGCGAQLCVFTSGRGNPTGFPFAPVIKITGNEFTYKKMSFNFDFDASPIISKGTTVDEMGNRLLESVLRVINGEETVSERIKADELFVVARR